MENMERISSLRPSGIFSRLYRNVLDEARNLGTVCGLRLYVEKANKQAQRTYQRLGMQQAIYDMYEVNFVLRLWVQGLLLSFFPADY